MVATGLLLTHNLKSFLAHPVLRDLQVPLDIREMLAFQELLDILVDQAHKAQLANPARPATPEKKELQDTMVLQELLVNQATMERREHLDTMVPLAFLVALASLVKMVTRVLQDLQVLKVKPAHQDTLFPPRSQALQAHLGTMEKMELQVTLEALAL